MADIPDSIGYLTVKGTIGLPIADTSDVGEKPDMLYGSATVKLIPNFRGPDPLIAVAEKIMLPAQPITCGTNGLGQIVPPADGIAAAPAPDAEPLVRVIAPNQLGLNVTDWTWTAMVSPGLGQGWQPYSRVFTGAPGDVIDLADLVVSSPSAGVLQALIYEVETTDAPYPAGFRVGVDYLLTPDGNLWKVDA